MVEKVEKVKKVGELFELIQYYYENRDRPSNDSENFFIKLEECCRVLELDLEEVVREFRL